MVKLLLVIFSAVGLLGVGCRHTNLEPAQDHTEQWFTIGDGTKVFGSIHKRSGETRGEISEHLATSLFKTEVFGREQEVRIESRSYLKRDLSLDRLESETTLASGQTKTVVSGHADHFLIERTTGNTTTTASISRDGPPLLTGTAFAETLRRLVLEGLPEIYEQKLRLLSEENGEVSDVLLRLNLTNNDGSVWTLETRDQVVFSTLRLDAAGEIVEQTVSVPPMIVRRVPVGEMITIESRVVSDRELLVFPVTQGTPSARQLETLDITLRWRMIPRDEFHLEDLRQHLISFDESDGNYTAVVRLTQPAASLVDLQRPLPHWQFAAELAPHTYIQPEDKKISALAQAICGSETSLRVAAKNICRWVHDYIHPEMIAETLSGPEVLERKIGKCTEYSTLFASLARAAGIPTRIVLGQRRFARDEGEFWGGHMWNEVYVGEWVPVDASVDEFGGSVSLLKFVHSHSVEGTQSLRWKLTQSLDVQASGHTLRLVKDIAPEQSTGVSTFRSVEAGFQIDLPDATWTHETRREGDALVVRLSPPDPDLGNAAMIHASAFDYPGNMKPSLILEARRKHQAKGMNEFQVLSEGDVKFEQSAGRSQVFRGKSKHGDPLQITEILLHTKKRGLLINLISTPELHVHYAPILEKIAASTLFLD